jgi:GntR family transcriptional regulator of vanillate catabolism
VTQEPVLTSAAQLAAQLRERILSGEIAPGARLQQEPLAETLGVSRTPLREALADLARGGLLDYAPNRGYTVRTFRLADVQQAFEVRERLEALACGLCARRGLDAPVRDRLAGCLADGDRILARGVLDPADLPDYRAMNVAFHETILAASGNALAFDLVRQIHNVPLASDRVFVWEDHAVIRRSHDDHHRILDAIAARNAERAEYLMREHIFYAAQVLRETARRQSGWLRLICTDEAADRAAAAPSDRP